MWIFTKHGFFSAVCACKGNGKYLQLENEKLCFKINVPEKDQQSAKWLEWHNALMAVNGTGGLKINKSVRRQGQWMTVAVLDGPYLQQQGALTGIEP